MAVKSLDEDLTIALTQETQDAWTSGAAELLDMGDKFNASRAFIEKYNQLVTSARDQKKPISWFCIFGLQQRPTRKKPYAKPTKRKKSRKNTLVHCCHITQLLGSLPSD